LAQWEQFGKRRNKEEERKKREKNGRKALTLTGLLMEGAKCVRLKLWAKLEVPPWSPDRNACVVYVCGSIEKFSGPGGRRFNKVSSKIPTFMGAD
jgi:hypothetical protein